MNRSAVAEAAVQDLKTRISGQVLRPGDEGYDHSRRVFNAMMDRSPALILRCARPEDVIHGVDFARERGLDLSIKGGGHSVAGNAVCEVGLMLDMSGMKSIHVDPARRIAVAESGLTLGEFDAATQAHGLATTLGVVSMTGIAGLTLGGGIGWLNGKYGLACDNLLSVDVVTADGQLRTAAPDQHDDLFWALRGGGGNFGVVVSFTYQLHPVVTVLGGGVSYPPNAAHEALRRYHEFASTCPDELSTVASIGRSSDGEPVVSVAVCWCGPLDEGERVVRPLRELGPPIADEIQPMPYLTIQSAPDAGFPLGRQHYWKASFLKDLPDQAIETILRFAAEIPSPYTGIGLQQMSGVASRVDSAATAFAHRARQYDFLILSQWDDPADSPTNIAWTRSLFEAMSPFLERGVYVNDLGEEGEDRVRAAYGGNYERLARVKAKYDPANLFRLNHNVRPTNESRGE